MSGECEKCGEHALECICKTLCRRHENGPECNVDHPKHYQGQGLEVIDVIESFELGFCLGNAIKYILRAGKKGDRNEDLEKAIWYLKREIES